MTVNDINDKIFIIAFTIENAKDQFNFLCLLTLKWMNRESEWMDEVLNMEHGAKKKNLWATIKQQQEWM